MALVGCTSKGAQRYSCEFDVLVVTEESRPARSMKFGDVYADVIFVTERDVLKPASPERAMAIAQAKPIRDTSLVLSTGSATSAATVSESAKVAGRTRLTSALKTIVRAEDSLTKKAVLDADFWLLAASYEYAYALLLSREVLPSPSHLLSQLRSASKGASKGFEGVSMGTGLSEATRAGCGARLEGIAILHDLLREGSDAGSVDEWSETRTEILSGKANELITRVELAECYSFLGQELVDAMLEIQRRNPKKTVSSLAGGKGSLIGERLVRQLGLVREEKAVRAGLDAVKQQVSLLAKKL